jgi:hypothetical protein
VFFVVCDGPRDLPEVAGNAWPQAIAQTRAVHHADLPITPVWRRELLVAGASSQEGRPKPVAVAHAALSGRGPSRDPAASRPDLIPAQPVTSATGPARPGHDRRSRAAGDAGLAGYGLMEWLPEVAEGDFRVS